MKHFLSFASAAVVLLISSCGDGKADAAKKIAAVADSIKAANPGPRARPKQYPGAWARPVGGMCVPSARPSAPASLPAQP